MSSIFAGKVMGYQPPAEPFEDDITGIKSIGSFGNDITGMMSVSKHKLFEEKPKKTDFGKFFSGALDVEGKAMQQLPTLQFDVLGLQRTRKQKNLNPLGDWDKDKKLNVFDCEPYNRKKQGFLDKTINLIKGHGFVEKEDIGKYPTTTAADVAFVKGVVSPSQYVLPQDIEKAKELGVAAGRGAVTGTKAVGRGVVSGARAVGTGLSNIYRASGAPGYFERRAEQRQWEQETKRAAQAEAMKYAQKLKMEKMMKGEAREMLGLEPTAQVAPVRAPSELQQMRLGVSEGVASVAPGGMRSRAAEYVDLMGIGRRGGYGSEYAYADDAPYRVASLVGGIGGGYWPQKVQESIGTKHTGFGMLGGQQVWSAQQPQPMPMAQPTPGLPTPQMASQPTQPTAPTPPSQPGMVWSEKSQKWVKYTRPSYKKSSRAEVPQTAPPPTPPPTAPQAY